MQYTEEENKASISANERVIGQLGPRENVIDSGNSQRNYGPDKTSKYYGVKGWLIIFCITLVFSSISGMMLSSKKTDGYDKIHDDLKKSDLQKGTPGYDAYLNFLQADKAMNAFMINPNPFRIILSLTGFTAVILIFLKKVRGIKLARFSLIGSLALYLFDIYLVIHYTQPDIIMPIVMQWTKLIPNFALQILWIVYLYKSKRVKATFGRI